MQFTRKRKRGQNKRIQRSWYSDEGYRILWRKQVHGVTVPARYSACIRSFVPNYSGVEGINCEIWDFVNRDRRLFKTLKAAEEACEKHYRLWSKACDASGIRALQDLFGKLPTSLPLWARKKMNRKALAVLMAPRNCKFVDEDDPCTTTPIGDEPSPRDLTETSVSSVMTNDGLADTATPVSSVAGVAKSTRKTRKTGQSNAKPAAAPAKARAKRASKRTAKPSASCKRKSTRTTASSKPARKPSKGSRTKKSKPSAN